jgi:hypothetical protein
MLLNLGLKKKSSNLIKSEYWFDLFFFGFRPKTKNGTFTRKVAASYKAFFHTPSVDDVTGRLD